MSRKQGRSGRTVVERRVLRILRPGIVEFKTLRRTKSMLVTLERHDGVHSVCSSTSMGALRGYGFLVVDVKDLLA